MASIKLIAVVLTALALSTAAILVHPTPPPGHIPATVHAPQGVLPEIVHHTGHDTVDAYAAALAHPAVLESVPCTCGCMPALGHRDNLDCYIDEILPDGTVAFSTHGLYCLVCQWITFDALEGHAAGLDGGELTKLVMERYGPHS